jgi:peptidoglycan/xylan/chitin deacetylase (PgdA/CDA1 family)
MDTPQKQISPASWLRVVFTKAHGIIINNHAQNARQIRLQVETLSSLVDFISYDQLADHVASTTKRPKPFCLLTFDDGRAVNALETAPELYRMGIPAVFYLVTDWTGTDHTLWFKRLEAIRRAAPENVPPTHVFKTIPWREREQRIHALCSENNIRIDTTNPDMQLMSWEDAKKLHAQGFEIGSHTANHAILPCESATEAERQITTSIKQLNDHGMRCRTFAFPNGNTAPDLVDMARRHGIESTVSTVPTWLSPSTDITCLPRLYLKEHATKRHIITKLAAARTGFLLRNPNGEKR